MAREHTSCIRIQVRDQNSVRDILISAILGDCRNYPCRCSQSQANSRFYLEFSHLDIHPLLPNIHPL